MPTDQTLTGVSGIGSAEAFGSQEPPESPAMAFDPDPPESQAITGAVGIPSAESFGRTDGVSIPIQTVPVSANYAH